MMYRRRRGRNKIVTALRDGAMLIGEHIVWPVMLVRDYDANPVLALFAGTWISVLVVGVPTCVLYGWWIFLASLTIIHFVLLGLVLFGFTFKPEPYGNHE